MNTMYCREMKNGDELWCWATGLRDKLALWWEFVFYEKRCFVEQYEGCAPRMGYIITGDKMRELEKRFSIDEIKLKVDAFTLYDIRNGCVYFTITKS